jgi:hypothetical protein
MDRKEAYKRLLREGFTTQQLEHLARLGNECARREMLDLPVEDRSSADNRLGSGLDRLSQWLKKESAFMFTRRHVGLLLIAISAASFGVMPILAHFAYAAGADPVTTLWLRFGIAAVVMTAIMLVRRMPFPRGRVLRDSRSWVQWDMQACPWPTSPRSPWPQLDWLRSCCISIRRW